MEPTRAFMDPAQVAANGPPLSSVLDLKAVLRGLISAAMTSGGKSKMCFTLICMGQLQC